MFKPATMPQTYYQQPIRIPGLKGYPVSSLEEARAAVVDFDGSIFIFPDIVNKRIYTKQINIDGTATLNMYELTALPPPTTDVPYVTRDDFNSAIGELKNMFMAFAEKLKNAEPVAQQQQQARPIF